MYLLLLFHFIFSLHCYRNRSKRVCETDLSPREKLCKFEKEMLENQELGEICRKVSNSFVQYFFLDTNIHIIFLYTSERGEILQREPEIHRKCAGDGELFMHLEMLVHAFCFNHACMYTCSDYPCFMLNYLLQQNQAQIP